MKRINNIYDKICDFNNIKYIYQDIKRNVRNKEKIIKFDEFHTFNLINIYNDLKNKTYIPKKYNIFLIRRPKYRIVMGQCIYDKIVNHLVARYLINDIVDKSLINSNVATREEKGTHFGMKILKKYLVNILREEKQVYALKLDISKYFYSIDHEVVKQLLKAKIKDEDALSILNRIIDSTDEEYINRTIDEYKKKELNRIKHTNLSVKTKNKLENELKKIPYYQKGKGLPIGNMTSQILAVFYLNELDHFIKEKLHAKYYIRYMDDIVILSTDKEYLIECIEEIKVIINKYKLKLNNKSCIIDVTKNGIDFLGFHYYLKGKKIIMKVRNSTKKRIRSFSKYNKIKVRNSYLSHLKHGDCYSLYKKLMG